MKHVNERTAFACTTCKRSRTCFLSSVTRRAACHWPSRAAPSSKPNSHKTSNSCKVTAENGTRKKKKPGSACPLKVQLGEAPRPARRFVTISRSSPISRSNAMPGEEHDEQDQNQQTRGGPANVAIARMAKAATDQGNEKNNQQDGKHGCSVECRRAHRRWAVRGHPTARYLPTK